MPVDDELISARDAAKIVGLPEATFYRFIRRGLVEPDHTVSDRYLFTRESARELRGVVRRVGREPFLAGKIVAGA